MTLSADDDLIDKARAVARARHSTLNDAFRQWLREFTASEGDAQRFDALMDSLERVNAGRRFSRDEMNER